MKYAMGSGSGKQNSSSSGLVGIAGSLLGGGKQSHSSSSGGSSGLAGLAGSLLGGGKQSSSGSSAGAGGLAGMASSFLGGGKQSSQSQSQSQGQGQYGGSSQQQGGNYSGDQTGNYSGAHQQQGSSSGGGLMGMVSGYLPGHVSFYPLVYGISANKCYSMGSRDRAGTDTLGATSKAATKDRHPLLRTILVVPRLRLRMAPRDKTRNTAAITSTAAASSSNLPMEAPHRTLTTTPSNNSSRRHHSRPTAARTNTSTGPHPQSQAHTGNSHPTSSTDSKRRVGFQDSSKAARRQETWRSRRADITLGEPMRAGCMVASRAAMGNMMEAIKHSNRADRANIRHRRRGGILHRRVEGVTTRREGIHHHRSTHRSIKGCKADGRDGGNEEMRRKYLMVDYHKLCYAVNQSRVQAMTFDEDSRSEDNDGGEGI